MISTLQKIIDSASVKIRGGSRVRVWKSEHGLDARITGRTPGPPPDKLLRIVLELEPDGPGVIDLRHDGRGNWKISARGELAQAVFVQRLRNVLVNS